MAFQKNDPNINRKGRPKNAEPELLREALRKEGAKRGIDFWSKVAEYAFRDKNVMIAVLKKFVPDTSINTIEGDLGQETKIVVIYPNTKEQVANSAQAVPSRLSE